MLQVLFNKIYINLSGVNIWNNTLVLNPMSILENRGRAVRAEAAVRM